LRKENTMKTASTKRSWNTAASRESVERTAKALAANGFEVHRVATGADAKAKVLELLPAGAEVFTMTSVTLDRLGISKEVNESGRYVSVRNALGGMSREKQGREMRRLGAAPDVALGSAHAVSETGTIVVASLTGSQLPAYVGGAGTVILVVGSQKIVRDVDEGMARVREYLIELESARARAAYGLPATFRTHPNKVLLMEHELEPGRVKIVLIDEPAGH
jgi:hypothetical protein